MSDLRACKVCREPVPSGQGEPCAVCDEWFHFSFSKAPDARRCGIFTGNVPGLVS
jgi:hypothetical protein